MQALLVHANEVHALSKRCGREDLAGVLAAEAGRWKDDTACIVVAGAQKRGKSRLLNALVDRPELLPVDVDVATHTYLAVRRGPQLSATVRRRSGSRIANLTIAPDDIADYASALGDPEKRRDVVGVEIAMEHPLLEGVRLVDTPGVDSLTVGHRHTTMAMLQEADALLFTVSAQDQPILRHELEFLIEAAQRVEVVAFVLTKVEDSTAWHELLEENRRRLADFVARESAGDGFDAKHAQRLLGAPWIPVSAKLAEASAARLALGQTERAHVLWERSGVSRLADYIRSCAGDRELARCGKVLAGTKAVLRALAAGEQDRLLAATESQDALQARLAEVEEANRDLAARVRERRRFAVEQQFLSREVATMVRAKLDELRRPYDNTIAGLTNKSRIDEFLVGLPESIELSLQAAWAEITDEVQGMATEALTEYLGAMGLDAIDIDLVALQLPTTTRSRLANRPAPPRPGFDMLREGVPGITMAASLSAMLAATGVLLPIALVAGPAVALGVTWRRHQYEQSGRSQAGIRQLIAETFSAAGTEMITALDRALARWRGEAEDSVEESMAAQRREAETRRAELTALSARDAAARREAAKVAEDRLATVKRLTAQAEELHASLSVLLAPLTRSG
ncbi:dynamin family protein [Dactylosporangium sp. AC04546]|uniref:dynamin family protein n=1 Tax=Dactylosporangium sp. AC04546 TaxID=2862460 RepID=UPI001EDD66DE|nr:dynamin family protein [Dactylosporangium sp. AC04546]WVK87099.1 dynamin family protein [Dactylosporangium sp. AC04546]